MKADGSEKKELADVLTRPYPERVAGKLISYAFDETMHTATITWEPDASVDAVCNCPHVNLFHCYEEGGPRWRILDRIPTWAHWSVRHPPGL